MKLTAEGMEHVAAIEADLGPLQAEAWALVEAEIRKAYHGSVRHASSRDRDFVLATTSRFFAEKQPSATLPDAALRKWLADLVSPGRAQCEAAVQFTRDALNERLASAVQGLLAAAQTVASADADPEVAAETAEVAMKAFLFEAWPILEWVFESTYHKNVRNPAERDEEFVNRTSDLFLRRKLPSPGDTGMEFIRWLAERDDPRGSLWVAGRNFTVDRLNALGAGCRVSTLRRPDLDGAQDAGDGIEPSGEDRSLLEAFEGSPFDRLSKILAGLPREDRVLLYVVHAEYGGLSDEDLASLAQKRRVGIADVRAELADRGRGRSEKLMDKKTRQARNRDSWYAKLLLCERKLRGVREQIHEIDSVSELSGPRSSDAPLDPRLLSMARERTSRLRSLDPAQRRRYCVALEEGFVDEIHRLSGKLSRRGRVLPDWEEVAVIFGEVPTDAPDDVRKTAANTVNQRYARLRKELVEVARVCE